jgi:hypothetical protein
MKKWLLGLLLGGFLGIFDGLSALLSAPETKDAIVGIVIGSTVKGILTGVLIGYFAQKVHSLPWVLLFGLGVGAFLAFLVALGNKYYWQVMLPGSVLGLIVGYATQRYGAPARMQTAPNGHAKAGGLLSTGADRSKDIRSDS